MKIIRLLCNIPADKAKAIYFYGPMGVTVFCNICLFVSTALKIVQHKKDTAHHLKGADSRRHDDNRQWFVLLFLSNFMNIKLLLHALDLHRSISSIIASLIARLRRENYFRIFS